MNIRKGNLIEKVTKEKYLFKKGVKKFSTDLPKTYLIKPTVIDPYNNNVWPEFAILSKFKQQGYVGVWVDSFHRKLWSSQGKEFSQNNLPERIKWIFLEKIKGCWDVVVWKNAEIKFIESKGVPSNDKIRETQINFLEKMLSKGFSMGDFLIIEWDYNGHEATKPTPEQPQGHPTKALAKDE